MRSVALKVPDDVTDEDAQLLLTVRLFEEGHVSLGAGAQLAGLSVRAFIRVLADRAIPIINYPASELVDDLAES